MKKMLLTIAVISCCISSSIAQDTLDVMFYNLLNFPTGGTADREDTLRKILQYRQPDILLVCELKSQAGADDILSESLNANGTTKYKKATYVTNQSPAAGLQNMAYYNSEKISLASQDELITDIRDINEYIFYYNSPYLADHNDTIFLDIYVAHLKASQGGTNAVRRWKEVNVFRQHIDAMGTDRNRIFCGDLNLYNDSEAAYRNLLDTGTYRMIDPTGLRGSWHENSSYTEIHTQSPRGVSLGDGGASGGLDDRFDFLLISEAIDNQEDSISYIPNSYITIGNDGNHYNQDLLSGTNTSVPDSVLKALYYMSDHLPISLQLEINTTIVTPPVVVTPSGSEGLIGFVAYNASQTSVADNFSFVALADIVANTEIHFTDNGWKDTDEFRTGEGIITWIAPIGGVACGTVVTIDNSPSASHGSVTESGSLALSGSGDQVIAYTGLVSAPELLAAVNSEGSAVWQANATSSNTSAVPLGLTNTVSAIALSEVDNAAYVGNTIFSSSDLARAAINNQANWTNTSNSVHQTPVSSFSITTCAGLPVELARFNGGLLDGRISLIWETLSELDNAYFDLEKSINGIDFETIYTIEGQGTSYKAHNYKYIDESPYYDLNYYRLKQVDFSGTYEYSEIITVDFNKMVKDAVQIIPNPVNDQINIVISNPVKEKIIVNIYTIDGRKVQNKMIESMENISTIQVDDLPKGTYIIQLITSSSTITKRIVKQ